MISTDNYSFYFGWVVIAKFYNLNLNVFVSFPKGEGGDGGITWQHPTAELRDVMKKKESGSNIPSYFIIFILFFIDCDW